MVGEEGDYDDYDTVAASTSCGAASHTTSCRGTSPDGRRGSSVPHSAAGSPVLASRRVSFMEAEELLLHMLGDDEGGGPGPHLGGRRNSFPQSDTSSPMRRSRFSNVEGRTVPPLPAAEADDGSSSSHSGAHL